MSKANIGWLFYKKMYEKGDNDSHIKKTLEEVLKAKAKDERFKAKHGFVMETVYPGLLIGSGYTHGLSSEEDTKLGFYFDHTTGLPLIQGSSVKGLLRSCFGLEFGNQKDAYKEQKHELIKELLQKELEVEALAKEIFEGIDPNSNEPKSIYERDIFYEARVVDYKRNLLDSDYITPHTDGALKNPNPIKFIKVSPEVSFEFNFDLKDGLISADEKEKLFIELLQIFGIGAKSNVGYGQLNIFLTEEEKAQKKKEEEERIAKEKEEKAQQEKAQKEQEQKEREAEQEREREAKKAKANEGINALLECNTLAEGFKILKDSLGKKPKPTQEQKEIILEFKKRHKKLSKSDEKTFKKYGI